MQLEVKELWRYPVKSMRGELLQEIEVTRSGVLFDRGWAVRDDEARTIRGAKHLGELLQCSARYLTDASVFDSGIPHARVKFPNGVEINTDDAKIHSTLSELLGRRVSLWPLQPASNEDHYRLNRLETGNFISELRRMMALNDDEPLPDLSGFPPNLARQLTKFASPPGTYFDAFPINVLTEASLRFLKSLLPDSQIDVRRFRPNILIADGEISTGRLEERWIGKCLRIGQVDIDIVMGCPRCIMVTRQQADLESDSTIMRTLVREANQSLSAYGRVATAGPIRVGQPVSVH